MLFCWIFGYKLKLFATLKLFHGLVLISQQRTEGSILTNLGQLNSAYTRSPMVEWGYWLIPVHWPNSPRSGAEVPQGTLGDLCWSLCQTNWRSGLQPQFLTIPLEVPLFLQMQGHLEQICTCELFRDGDNFFKSASNFSYKVNMLRFQCIKIFFYNSALNIRLESIFIYLYQGKTQKWR